MVLFSPSSNMKAHSAQDNLNGGYYLAKVLHNYLSAIYAQMVVLSGCVAE